jgi:hypothetical protein
MGRGEGEVKAPARENVDETCFYRFMRRREDILRSVEVEINRESLKIDQSGASRGSASKRKVITVLDISDH